MEFCICYTNDRAMGNAYCITDNCENMQEYVVLCDLGIMGIYKAFAERHINVIKAKHIDNVTADRLQKNGIDFFEIRRLSE